MTYVIYEQEVSDELQEFLQLSDDAIGLIIESRKELIKGCFEREMTSEEVVDLIVGGRL